MNLRTLTYTLVLVCALGAGLAPAEAGPGARMPDLVPWSDSGADYFVERVDGRLRLRFSAGMTNTGTAALIVTGRASRLARRIPAYQLLPKRKQGQRRQRVGEFFLDPDAVRWDLVELAEYRVLDTDGNEVVAATKVSFCVIDEHLVDPQLQGAPAWPQYRSCPSAYPRKNIRVGLSVGWADVYDADRNGQWIDVTDVPRGTYTLEIRVNPNGLLIESNPDNNVLRRQIEL